MLVVLIQTNNLFLILVFGVIELSILLSKASSGSKNKMLQSGHSSENVPKLTVKV